MPDGSEHVIQTITVDEVSETMEKDAVKKEGSTFP